MLMLLTRGVQGPPPTPRETPAFEAGVCSFWCRLQMDLQVLPRVRSLAAKSSGQTRALPTFSSKSSDRHIPEAVAHRTGEHERD